MASKNYTQEQFIEAVKNSYSYSGVCRILGISPKGGNLKTVKNKIQQLELNASHFTGQRWNRGKTSESHSSIKKKDISEILVENSGWSSGAIRQRLIKEGLKESKCECCGRSEWMGIPIPLELHHINEIHTDNRLENLLILCPNCHAQTDNYCGKRKKRKLPEKHKMKTCQICGKEYSGKNKFCSKDCYEKYKKQNFTKYQRNITKEKLINGFIEFKTFTGVGRHFNVSDKTISKWCESFGLPQTSKKMKEYLSSI